MTDPSQPTIEDLLGPDPNAGAPQAPTLEPIPGQPGASRVVPPPTIESILGPPPPAEPPPKIFDRIFNTPNSPQGQVMKQVGLGFAAGFGDDPFGVGQETEEWLRKNGVWNDQQDGKQAVSDAFTKGQIWPLVPYLARSFNEKLMQGVTSVGEMGSRAMSGAVSAAGAFVGGEADVSGLTQAVDALGGKAYEPGRLGAELSQAVQSEMAAPGGLHLPEPALEAPEIADARNAAVTALSPQRTLGETLRDARSMGIVGSIKNDEGIWKGTVEGPYPGPAPAAARAMDAEAGIADVPPTSQEAAAPAPPDIHAVARQIAPDTFAELDPLVTRQAAYQRWISELQQQNREAVEAAPPHAEALTQVGDQIDTILGKVNGVEDRLTGRQAAKLDDLRQQQDDLQAANEEAARTDTPDVTRLRGELQKIDYRMRDLAPDVSAAYRAAAERMPPGEEAPAEAVAAPAQEAPEAAEGAPEPEAPAQQSVESESPTAPPAAQVIPAAIAEQESAPKAAPINIAEDVSQRLAAAGRPPEEAGAAAQIVAAHYEARAERFGGANGTADEMYQRDAAQIKGAEAGGRGGNAAGKTVLRNGRATITLFGKADASTFLHETGHQWLDELLKDAADERAPDDLKSDAAAARAWMGADETGAISTRQHEKFARGFERYFLEGRAPSSRLAGVFEQFKNWLGTIYQNTKKLGAPITPDIRDVFDRLLSKPSERIVTAPDPAKEFADIHEADAEHTPPARAGVVADTVRKEIDQTAAQHAPVTNEEVGDGSGSGTDTAGATDAAERPDGGAGGQAGGGPAAPGDNAGGEPAPGPVGAGEGRAPELDAVAGGGSEVAREGASVPAKQLVPARPEPGADARPIGPNARLTEPESRLVDKAGNIRLDNLNTPEAINQYFREMAEQNDDFMAARRGVVSDAQVMDAAASMGLKPSDLDVNRLRQEFSAEKIYATRQLFIQAGNDLHLAAAAAADGDMAALGKYAEARSRLRMVQEYLAAITAEAGRGLRAFRRMEGDFGQAQDVAALVGNFQDTRTLFQMQEEAKRVATLDSAAKVNKYLRDVEKPGLGAMALEAFKNALISNPVTHAIYLEGNAAMALLKAIPETMAEVAFGRIKEAVTGEAIPERATLGEVRAQVNALFVGQRTGLKAAWDAFRSGQTTELPGEGEGGSTPFTNTKAIPGIAGDILRAPGERMVAPLHSYSRTMTYFQSVAQQAVRQASTEGLNGFAYDARVADLKQNPTPAMMEKARDFANQATLMSQGGDLTRRISGLVNWKPNIPGLGPTKPLAFIDPFVTVSSNILEQSLVERTPLGLLSSRVRADLSGANGFAAQSQAAARMGVGTSIALVAGGLAAEGTLTPSGPSTPNEAAIWQAVHGMPHSLKIGNMSYDLSHLGPIGQLMGVAADMYHIGDRVAKGQLDGMASLVAEGFARNFLDVSSMKGISDMMKALEESDRYGEPFVRNFLASAFPFSQALGQAAREVDPYARQARTMLDAIKAKIPFESETLQPRIDLWGQPVPNREFAGLIAKRLTDDPLNKELLAEGYYPALPEHKINGVPLSDSQYFQYAQLAGQLAHRILTPQVSSPLWQQMPVLVRHDIVKSAIEGSRAMARAQLKLGSIGSDNDIIAKALGNKRAQFDRQPMDDGDY